MLAFAINLRTVCVHDIYFVETECVENEMEMRVRRWVVEKDRREAGRSFLHSGRGGPGMTTLASVFLLLSVFVFVDGLVFLPQWQR